MNNPLVSVIVPVYNASLYIEECINSLLAQTYTHLEVLVVDDGSKDDSIDKVYALVNNYRGPITFSILRHDFNRGVSAARNTGIDASSGVFISFLDSDDFILPTMYETLVKGILAMGDNVAILGCCSQQDARINQKNQFKVIASDQFAEEFLSANTIGVVWAKLFRRDLFESIRFQEGKVGEDFLLMSDLYQTMEKKKLVTIILPDQLYYYRWREDSITTSRDCPYSEKLLDNLKAVYKKLQKRHHPCATAVEKRYLRHLYYHILSLVNNGGNNKRAYYRYCLKLWEFHDFNARKLLPDKTDFKPFLLMKYSPFLYCIYSRYSQRGTKS